MKFTIERKVESNVYSVTIAYKEYGTNSLDAEAEKKILNCFQPTLVYSDITFTGNYTVNSGNVQAGGTDSIKLSLNNRKVKIDNTFSVAYRVDVNSIAASEYSSNTAINKPELLAQAQCKLFEDKVKAQLKTVLDKTRSMNNDFVNVEEVTV